MEYEFTMSLMNLSQDPEIETVFLMAEQEYSHFSSTLIRDIAAFGGNLDQFVPAEVKEALQARAREQHNEH
jgi:pantetheine-phosphate adenylyltransferase